MAKKLVSIIIICMLMTLPNISMAVTSSELNDQKNDIENKIDEAKDRQDDIKNEVNQTRSELDKINDEITEKEYEIEEITAKLNTLNAEVDNLTKDLKEAEEKYDEQYDVFCKRLVAQYKKGSVSYLDVLLNSSSLTEFISSYYIIEKIAEYDTKLLDGIEEQKQIINKSKKEMEQKQREVEDKKAQLKLEESILTNKRQNKSKYISQLSNEEQELQKEIENYNKEIKKIENQLLEIAKQNSGGNKYTGGKLEWPVPNYSRISSYFGYRGSAATGGVGTANHNGYDIAAPHNSSILSAESGTVIKVVTGCAHDYPKKFSTRCNCGGGYGNYFMIQHDNGLTTLYGHCASVDVRVGQRVSRGEKVAAVGSSGWSTGNHLHFSVIRSGTYVNPGDYLGSK